MKRSCSLRWRCFVTPGTVSSAPSRQTVEQKIAPHGTEDYTAWNVLGSALYQLTPQGSVTMPHSRSVYCSILLYLALFVWIILFLDYLYVILLVFSAVYLSPIFSQHYKLSWSRVRAPVSIPINIYMECSYETRSFDTPYFRSRSLCYSTHESDESHVWFEYDC